MPCNVMAHINKLPLDLKFHNSLDAFKEFYHHSHEIVFYNDIISEAWFKFLKMLQVETNFIQRHKDLLSKDQSSL